MNETFWDTVCDLREVWRPLAVVAFIVAVLTLATLPYLDHGSGSFVAAVVTVVMAGVTLTLFGVIRYRCQRR